MFFFFSDPATTEIYTLPQHAALPICLGGDGADSRRQQACRSGAGTGRDGGRRRRGRAARARRRAEVRQQDRKSTRLNSSHDQISYAVFCLKKKRKTTPECPDFAILCS